MKKLFPILTILTALALIVCQQSEVGWISIQSTPEGAEVYLDDSLTGEVTNCVLDEVLAGEHHLKLTLEDYEDWDSTVNVEMDESTLVEAELFKVDTISEKTLVWKYAASVRSSPAIGHDGNVYFTSYDDNLVILSPDGSLVREVSGIEVGSFSYISIASDGTVYVISSGLHLTAVNPDGSIKWEYELPSYGYTFAIGSDGSIYFCKCTVYGDELHAISSEGVFKWSIDLPGYYSLNSPIVGADGTIYVEITDGYPIDPEQLEWEFDHYLTAVSPGGSVKWQVKDSLNKHLEGRYLSPLSLGFNGFIYRGIGKHLYAYDSEGFQKWKFNTDRNWEYRLSTTAVDEDGIIYFYGADGWEEKLFAIAPEGYQKWGFYINTPIPSDCFSCPMVGLDGVIYVRSEDGYLYALNPDGNLRWMEYMGGNVSSSPALADDGTLYIAGADGVYAIKTSSRGLANSPWPKYRADNQNTGRARF